MKIKKALITGAGGFIGSHLTEKCVEMGYSVKAFIRYNSKNNCGWLENSKHLSGVEIIAGDVRDFDSIYGAMTGCDTVFHLAALIGIPYSYVSPLAYIKTNIEGTYNVLEAAKMLNGKNILITSTSETYGTAQYVPIDEKHPVNAQSPYAATKIAADALALSFFRSYNLPVKIVRPFNVYGPRQSARAIIPSIISQVADRKKEIKIGNTFPTRDLTFVEDTVRGFIKIAESDKLFGDVVNIGVNSEISVKELVMLIFRLMNRRVKIISDKKRVRPDKSEVERLLCDNSKLRSFTDWMPCYSIEDGLKKTIEWFGKNKNIYKSDLYNI